MDVFGRSSEDRTLHLQDCARSALVLLEMLIHQHLGVAEQAILRTGGPTSCRRVWGRGVIVFGDHERDSDMIFTHVQLGKGSSTPLLVKARAVSIAVCGLCA